jgi:hypothetical protein
MAAISQVIPNLLGGVSQQPDPLKLPGQVREAENVLLDPTFGCRKRPPTQFIGKLSSDIPTNAKWFPIFRDGVERYVITIYKNSAGTTVVKAFDTLTALETSVTIDASAVDYLDISDVKHFEQLTINDYTLLANKEKIVSMDTSTSDPLKQEALVNVNQIAYNTTYNIDFLKDGDTVTPEKRYRAKSISVSPASFETDDDSCAFAGAQNFILNGSGDKAGLSFRLTTNCTPTSDVTTTPGVTYPTGLSYTLSSQIQKFYVPIFGSASQYGVGSTLYTDRQTDNGNLVVRIVARVGSSEYGNRYDTLSTSIVSYVAGETGSKQQPWAVGNGGLIVSGGVTMVVKVTSIGTTSPTPDYDYKSVYSASVTLNNGGANWRVGDTVTTTMNGKSYTITVTGEAFGYSYVSEASVSYTTAATVEDGALDVGQIVGGLVQEINLLSNYTATPIGSTIYIERNDGKEFNIQTRGGTADNALTGVKGSVNDISSLPEQCVEGVVLKVRNTIDSDADDYYVRFVPASGDIPGQGSWEETVKPGIKTDLNPFTMPLALIRQADGTFVVRPLSVEFDEVLSYAPREVGDDATNPQPSFVGKSITGMFFFSNRLGFLSQDSVILSQPGDYFNFFVGSAIAVSDADPIDMTASSTKPATLKAALGTPKGLLLFAENSQFLLSTSEAAFGPATVKLAELSNYAYSSNVPPLETGVSVLFSTEAETFSKVYEMAVDSIDNRPLVSENTRIIPEYIPPNLTIAASSPNNSLVAYGDGSDLLWIFKFFNTGNERSLAGWSKWRMPSPVQMLAFDHDTGYFVCNNNGDTVLLKLEMLDDPRTSPISAFGFKFTPRLDHSLFKSQVTIEADTDPKKRVIRFPVGSYVDAPSGEGTPATPCIILTLDDNSTLFRTPEIQEDSTGYYVVVDTEIAGTDFILGLEYMMKVELPTFFVSENKKADRRNIPMVENVYLDLYYSGRYSVTIDRTGYQPRTVDLNVTNSDIYFANSAAIDELSSKGVPVYSRGDFSKLTIRALDPLPSSITSYRWEGHYNNRGISIV